MSLCETCTVRERCTFFQSVRLAQLQWAEKRQSVTFQVATCSVRDYLDKMTFQAGSRVEVDFRGNTYKGAVVAPPSEASQGYIEVLLDEGQGPDVSTVMLAADKVRRIE